MRAYLTFLLFACVVVVLGSAAPAAAADQLAVVYSEAEVGELRLIKARPTFSYVSYALESDTYMFAVNLATGEMTDAGLGLSRPAYRAGVLGDHDLLVLTTDDGGVLFYAFDEDGVVVGEAADLETPMLEESALGVSGDAIAMQDGDYDMALWTTFGGVDLADVVMTTVNLHTVCDYVADHVYDTIQFTPDGTRVVLTRSAADEELIAAIVTLAVGDVDASCVTFNRDGFRYQSVQGNLVVTDSRIVMGSTVEGFAGIANVFDIDDGAFLFYQMGADGVTSVVAYFSSGAFMMTDVEASVVTLASTTEGVASAELAHVPVVGPLYHLYQAPYLVAVNGTTVGITDLSPVIADLPAVLVNFAGTHETETLGALGIGMISYVGVMTGILSVVAVFDSVAVQLLGK